MTDQRTVDRPPRIQPELPQDQIQIPNPPSMESSRNQTIFQSFLPLVTIIGYVLVGASGQGRNLLLLIPMGLSVIASSGLAIYNLYRAGREDARKKEAYTQRLTELRKEMVAAHDMQRTFYMYNYPVADVVLSFGTVYDSRSGSRLWERRVSDDDFGLIRLGIGTRPSHVVYTISMSDNEESPLMNDALKLAADSEYIDNTPITIPLWQKNPDGMEQDEEAPEMVAHTLGIAGDAEHVYPMIRAMLAGFVGSHSPTDANLYVVGVNQVASNWEWASGLPHFPPPPKIKVERDVEKPKVWFPLCFEKKEGRDDDLERDRVSLFWKTLRIELDNRSMRLQDRSDTDGESVRLPFMIVVVDMLEAVQNDNNWPKNSALQSVESSGAVAMIMQRGQELGAAIIFLVPERRKVPSACQAVIEVASVGEGESRVVDFRYAEVGVNTPRYVGRADLLTQTQKLKKFAEFLGQLEVPRSYGEGITDKVTLLDLNKATLLSHLEIVSKWKHSLQPENAEWLQVPIGLMSGNEVRKLYFSADRDGVHGLVAGSTGSGKSELLMTLILGLAINYDPSIVNFVLVDFKGGQAFDPFKELPHKVDIVTDLEGAAVARMFAAIKAELQRREHINTLTNSKHIVHYREKGLHLLEPEEYFKRFGDEKPNYPNLFIIIDEFAEMIASNPEYRDELNSITRLGRALGVTLILAAQRPTGVTDQMRANIKFRVCLRVETREESAEMLRRPDAAYLPPGTPGRGYLQVGNENIELVQVAYTGADYTAEVINTEADLSSIDWAAYQDEDIIWLDLLSEPQEPPKLFEVLVREFNKLAREHSTPQKKPWPSPLPRFLTLGNYLTETEYLQEEHRSILRGEHDLSDRELALNYALREWSQDQRSGWDGINWPQQAMRPVVGLVDHPSSAKQLILQLNFRQGHHVVFGVSGSGKTTFLRTVMMSLAATHSPEELHMYVLDFGGRNLDILRGLPHVGAVIPPIQEERVERLLRKLENIIEEREEILSQAGGFIAYNAAPDRPRMPAILVVIDNFAEFRESFEELLPTLISLIRGAIAQGVYFILSAENPNVLPGKLYNLFTERFTLRMADKADYTAVVGRGVTAIDEVAGRGFVAMEQMPLQFQTALPIGDAEYNPDAEVDINTLQSEELKRLVDNMDVAWGDDGWSSNEVRPFPVALLENQVKSLLELYSDLDHDQYVKGKLQTGSSVVGILDSTLQPALIHLRQQPHFVISGVQLSGKTTLLQTWILSLAYHNKPSEVGMILIDSQGGLFDYIGGKHSLAELPHVLSVVSEDSEINEEGKRHPLSLVMKHLNYEFEQVPAHEMPQREIFIFMDNYDDLEEMLKQELAKLVSYTRSRRGRPAVHFILCGSQTKMSRSGDNLLRRVTSTRYGIAMEVDSAGKQPFSARISRKLSEQEFPIGRSFIVQSGKLSILQIITPHNPGQNPEIGLDTWVEIILDQHGDEKAEWLPLPPEENLPGTNGSTDETVVAPPAPTEEDNALAQLPREQIERFRHYLLLRALEVNPEDGVTVEEIRKANALDIAERALVARLVDEEGNVHHIYSAQELQQIRNTLLERLKDDDERYGFFGILPVDELYRAARNYGVIQAIPAEVDEAELAQITGELTQKLGNQKFLEALLTGLPQALLIEIGHRYDMHVEDPLKGYTEEQVEQFRMAAVALLIRHKLPTDYMAQCTSEDVVYIVRDRSFTQVAAPTTNQPKSQPAAFSVDDFTTEQIAEIRAELIEYLNDKGVKTGYIENWSDEKILKEANRYGLLKKYIKAE